MHRVTNKLMKTVNQVFILWLFISTTLFHYSCTNKKDAPSQITPGEKLITYLDQDKYEEAIALVKNNQFESHDYPIIAELYYTLMTLSNSCYQTSLRLNQINLEGYLETANKEHQALIYASKYFLGYTYFLAGDTKNASRIIAELAKKIPQQNFLYPRTQLLNAKLNGSKVNQAAIQAAPYMAYNLGFNPEKWGVELEESQAILTGTQLDLERAITAWRLKQYPYLNRLFNSTLAPTFSYQIKINDTLTVKMYNPESLLLATYYYQHQLEQILDQIVGPENSIYKYYLAGRLAIQKGEYELAATKYATIIQQQVLSPKENEDLEAIRRALGKKLVYDAQYTPTDNVFDPKLLPATKYWFYEDLSDHRKSQGAEKFFRSVNTILQSTIAKEDISVPTEYDQCDFKELLYIIGLYFLNHEDTVTSEKYFYHLYHFTESFYPHKNPKCGITYEYQPSAYLVYASLALMDHPRLKRVVLQAIKNESVTNPIYRIPSEILSNIFIAPNLTGSNPQN